MALLQESMNTVMYVTGFVKTVPNGTELKSFNIKVSYILALSRHTKHMAVDTHICFTDNFLPTLSNHEGALQNLWSQWMALKGCVWCQPTANDYLGLSCGLCLFLLKRQHCYLCPDERHSTPPTVQPSPSPTPVYMPLMDITETVKKFLEIQQY